MPQGMESLRSLRKHDNRKKLIEATIELIAEEGIASVTVSRVVERAGVSRGLINLHFETKEAMMVEVMDTLNFEWRDALRDSYRGRAEEGSETAAETLHRTLMISLNPPILDPRKTAVWYCFYADPWYRKIYQDRYFETDQEALEAVAKLIGTLIEEGGYAYESPLNTARALRALMNGLWLELLTEPDKTNMEEARSAYLSVLTSLFPKHFPLETHKSAS